MAITIQTVAFPSVTGLGTGPLNDFRFSKSQQWAVLSHPTAGVRLMKRNASGDDYNTAGLISVTGAVAGGAFDACFSDDENTLYYCVSTGVYYATRSGDVWTHAGTVASPGGTVRGLAVSSARAHIAIATGTLYQIRSLAGTVYVSVSLANCEDVAFSPNGEFCVIANRTNAVRVYQWNGTTYVLLTVTGSTANAGNWQISFRPDGKQFIVAEYLNTTGVFPYNLSGTNTWTLQSSIFAQQTIGACYFTNGKFAIAMSATGSTRQLWTMDGFTFTPDTATMTLGSSSQIRSTEDGSGITFAACLLASPYLAIFKSPNKVTSESVLTAPKAKVDGSVKVTTAANAALKAPKATLASYVGVPYVGQGALIAPKATTVGSLAIAGVETPIEEHFGVQTAFVMIENSAYNWFDQVPDEGALYGILTAPKPKFAGYGTQGRLVFSALTAPKAKTGGLLSNPYYFEGVMAAQLPDVNVRVANQYLTAPLVAPKAKVAASVNVPFWHFQGALSAPKATAAGNIGLRAKVTGAPKAPKALVAGQIGNLYLRGILTAPKAKTGGVVGTPYKLSSALTARLPVTNFTVWQKVRIEGAAAAPKSDVEGYLTIADVEVSAHLTAPKATVAGNGIVPFVITAPIVAPKATVDGNASIQMAVVGALTAPKAKFAGLALRYLRADALLVAPKAKLAGRFERLLKFTGLFTAPKAKMAGQLKINFKVDGAFAAPKAVIAGQVKQTVYVNGVLTAPKPQFDGFAGADGALLGDLVAPAATLTGDLDVATAFFGDLSAPAATMAGELELFEAVRAELTAPAATTDGLLDLRYLLEGIGSAPLPQVDFNIALRYDVEGSMYAPSPNADGILRASYNIDGEISSPAAVVDGVFALFYPVDAEGDLTAPSATAEGYVNNITSVPRRSLTIIRR